MKQIIVVTNLREKYERDFAARDFYVVWCPFSVEQLLKYRDRSNIIFLIPDREEEDDVKSMGLYLRDLCIEDEKILYIYGKKDRVDILVSKVPSLYVKKAMYSHTNLHVMLDEIINKDIIPESGKPVLLIIDEESDYIERLRPYLDEFFEVYVCPFDIKEIGILLMKSDLVLVSMEGKLKVSEFMGFFHALLMRKKSANFFFYYLAATDKDRDRINAGSEGGSIAFSKEIEVSKIAKFFIKRYAEELKKN